MAIYGSFNKALVKEAFLLDANGNLNSDDFTLHTNSGSTVVQQPDEKAERSVSAAIKYDFDSTTTNPHYTHFIDAVDDGTTPGSPLTGYGSPMGILFRRKLNPGETLTISGYFVNGQHPQHTRIYSESNTYVGIMYENRPGQMQSFTREGETLSDDGLYNVGKAWVLGYDHSQGIPVSPRVRVISPWEYSSGESYGDYFPVRNVNTPSGEYSGTDDEAAGFLSVLDMTQATGDSSGTYSRYFRIKIANDSDTAAALKLIAFDANASESDEHARIGIYRLKATYERGPALLKSISVGASGDVNFKGSPTEFVASVIPVESSLTNEPAATASFFGSNMSAYLYSWMVRSLNCRHVVPGQIILPLGGTDPSSQHMNTRAAYDFNAEAVDQLPTGFTTNSAGAVEVQSNNAGNNRALVFGPGGVATPSASVTDPPDTANNYRWVEIDGYFLGNPINVSFKAYQGRPGGDYGTNNIPEDIDVLRLQYKIESGTWTSAGDAIVAGDNGANGTDGSGTPWNLTTTINRSIANPGETSDKVYLRWITSNSSTMVDYDHWVIDDIQIVGSRPVTVRTYRCFVAPNNGMVKKLKFRFANKFTGDIKIKLLDFNDALIDERVYDHSASYKVTHTYTVTLNDERTISLDTDLFVFSRGDVIGLAIETDTNSDQTLGSILSTCVLRFSNNTLRVIT